MRFVSAVALFGALVALAFARRHDLHRLSGSRQHHSSSNGAANAALKSLRDAARSLSDALEQVEQIRSIGGYKLRQGAQKIEDLVENLKDAIDERSAKVEAYDEVDPVLQVAHEEERSALARFRDDADRYFVGEEQRPVISKSHGEADRYIVQEQQHYTPSKSVNQKTPPEARIRGSPAEKLKAAMDVRNYNMRDNPRSNFFVLQTCVGQRCRYHFDRFGEKIPMTISKAFAKVNEWRARAGYPAISTELNPVLSSRKGTKMAPEDQLDGNASYKFMAAMDAENYIGPHKTPFPVEQPCGETMSSHPVRYMCRYGYLKKDDAIEKVNAWRVRSGYPAIPATIINALPVEDIVHFN